MFISYAQNGEDVLLHRALGHIERGFYVDVGAGRPVIDSVTCAFYLRGWRGMNLEPAPEPFGYLTEKRPEDINLNIAIGETEGTTSFFVVKGADVLSTAAPEQRAALARQGYRPQEITVPIRPLAAVLAEHVTGPIHFLKIDVEGLERSVLASADFTRFRPWIVLVEATAPTSQAQVHGEWEDLLLTADYDFAWFDGLNRYYVAREQQELAGRLQVQPNVFDKFKRYDLARAEGRIEELTRERDEARQELALLRQRLGLES